MGLELDGRTCLVTGANRGIGHASAGRLAEEPVRLLVGGARARPHPA